MRKGTLAGDWVEIGAVRVMSLGFGKALASGIPTFGGPVAQLVRANRS